LADPKQQKLDQIAAEIVKNNVCPDLAKTAKHMVFGEGNPDASIIFIGEAPGRNEDETGRPFIGAAGKFLSELLEGIGLERGDVYITSIVKYRPPKNRDPKPAEKAEFWPYLQAQLEVIQPKLIVTLGRHGLNCFLPKAIIGTVHGQPQQWEGYTILPLYHPAAVLYSRKMQPILVEDFARIKQFISH
jgi:uracil-DNA glycosylase family 4